MTRTIVFALASLIATTGTALADPSRTEFRYPDEPTVARSADGIRTVDNTKHPIAFKAYANAISAEDARSFMTTSTGLPRQAPQLKVADLPESPLLFERHEPTVEVARAPSAATNALVAPYGVQVGAFSDFDNANRFMVQMGAHGQVRISHAVVNGRDFYRVFIEAGTHRGAADQLLSALSGQGIDGFVVKAS